MAENAPFQDLDLARFQLKLESMAALCHTPPPQEKPQSRDPSQPGSKTSLSSLVFGFLSISNRVLWHQMSALLLTTTLFALPLLFAFRALALPIGVLIELTDEFPYKYSGFPEVQVQWMHMAQQIWFWPMRILCKVLLLPFQIIGAIFTRKNVPNSQPHIMVKIDVIDQRRENRKIGTPPPEAPPNTIFKQDPESNFLKGSTSAPLIDFAELAESSSLDELLTSLGMKLTRIASRNTSPPPPKSKSPVSTTQLAACEGLSDWPAVTQTTNRLATRK